MACTNQQFDSPNIAPPLFISIVSPKGLEWCERFIDARTAVLPCRSLHPTTASSVSQPPMICTRLNPSTSCSNSRGRTAALTTSSLYNPRRFLKRRLKTPMLQNERNFDTWRESLPFLLISCLDMYYQSQELTCVWSLISLARKPTSPGLNLSVHLLLSTSLISVVWIERQGDRLCFSLR